MVYFGGHGRFVEVPDSRGDVPRKRGYLATYDFDPVTPTQYSLLMDDITEKQFRYMIPRQVAFFIDACSSGLALLSSLGEPRLLPEEKQLGKYSVIRVEERAVPETFWWQQVQRMQPTIQEVYFQRP